MTRLPLALLLAAGVAAPAAAQDGGRVDFVRDIQPIFRTSCVGCHGPSIHQNGFRLDRRSDAMRGGTIPVIGPGNADASRLYLRLTGDSVGAQMPPTGALKPEQLALVKAWIDQGAEWPDAASGETPAAPPDPHAARMLDALRAGNGTAFRDAARAAGTIGARKGPGGTTPLMQAALYGSADDMRFLIERGADVNARNDAGATALIWASHDLEKTRLLLDGGADVNLASDHGRTALMAAVGRSGTAAVVKLLLERGANPSASGSDSSVLFEASLFGDADVVRMLLDAGADVAAAGPAAPVFALKAGCIQCAEWMTPKLPKPVLDIATRLAGPPLGDSRHIGFFIDRGGDVNVRDSEQRTLLMLAAATDAATPELVSRLIGAGADVNASARRSETALMHARLHGNARVADLLVRAGARHDAAPAPAPTPSPAASARAAVERSLPLLQRSDETFVKKTGCVSCHNNTLTAMTVAAARTNGLAVNEDIARRQRSTIAAFVDSWRDRVLQGIGIPGDQDTISYILLGLAAEGLPADASTDAMAHFLLHRQWPDGGYRILVHRPPIESSDIEVTAACARALQLYAPRVNRARFDQAIKRAGQWLLRAQPQTTEDRAFHLLGLRWTDAPPAAIRNAGAVLVREQRANGGWAQISGLEPDAYATGQALYALVESGAVPANDPAIARATTFLVDTQLADGSWFVKSRAIALQPYFESGFPHGHDQWISAAGTNWAALALTKTLTVRKKS